MKDYSFISFVNFPRLKKLIGGRMNNFDDISSSLMTAKLADTFAHVVNDNG